MTLTIKEIRETLPDGCSDEQFRTGVRLFLVSLAATVEALERKLPALADAQQAWKEVIMERLTENAGERSTLRQRVEALEQQNTDYLDGPPPSPLPIVGRVKGTFVAEKGTPMPGQMTAKERRHEAHDRCRKAEHRATQSYVGVCRDCFDQAIREAEEAMYDECKDYFRHDHGCSADIDEGYDPKTEQMRQSKYPCRCGLTEFRKRFAERGRDDHQD